jgi:hypothetical protein
MPLSMHQIVTPIFNQTLPALSNILGKAADYAQTRKIEPEALLKARLYPDMLPFDRQVQTAADNAARCMARLAGAEVPSFPDTEKTFAELQQRIAAALAYVNSIKPEQLDGSEMRDIKLVFPSATLEFKGLQYVQAFVLPNFYFHATTAYDILRHNGLEIGKLDFVGRR